MRKPCRVGSCNNYPGCLLLMGRGLASQHFFLNLVLLYVVCWISTVVFVCFWWSSKVKFLKESVPSEWFLRPTQEVKHPKLPPIPPEVRLKLEQAQGALEVLIHHWVSRLRHDSFKYWWILHHLGYSNLEPMNFNYQPSKVGRGPYISNMSRWKTRAIANILSQPQIYRTASMPLPWTVAISRRHWVAWCSYNSIK